MSGAVERVSGRPAAVLAALLLLAGMVLWLNPIGYAGGGWDDGRYGHMILRVAENAAALGTNHWELRWPVVWPGVAAVEALGTTRFALLLSPVLYLAALIVVNFVGAWRLLGATAAAIGLALLVTTPELLRWGTRLNPDVPEVLFWSMALWSFAFAAKASSGGDAAQTRNWLLMTGISAGLAWATRETSLGLLLLLGLAFLMGIGVRRSAWAWVGGGFALVVLPEMLALWEATGDPLYRLHVDLNHTQIHSNDLVGGVAPGGQAAPLNPAIMSRWDGAGPVHLHWAFDPWINLAVNRRAGLVFPILAVLLVAFRRSVRKQPTVVIAIAAVVLANILTNLYIANTDPKIRMFFPALTAACIGAGWLAASFGGRRTGWFILACLAVKLALTFEHTNDKASFNGVEALAGQAVARVEEPVYILPHARSHLLLAAPAVRARLRPGIAPPGGIQMTVGVRGDIEGHEPPPAGIAWRPLWQRSTGQYPLVLRLTGALKPGADPEFKAVRVTLYRREAAGR